MVQKIFLKSRHNFFTISTFHELFADSSSMPASFQVLSLSLFPGRLCWPFSPVRCSWHSSSGNLRFSSHSLYTFIVCDCWFYCLPGFTLSLVKAGAEATLLTLGYPQACHSIWHEEGAEKIHVECTPK